jgi:hypothetical protein
MHEKIALSGSEYVLVSDSSRTDVLYLGVKAEGTTALVELSYPQLLRLQEVLSDAMTVMEDDAFDHAFVARG